MRDLRKVRCSKCGADATNDPDHVCPPPVVDTMRDMAVTISALLRIEDRTHQHSKGDGRWVLVNDRVREALLSFQKAVDTTKAIAKIDEAER